MLSKTSIQAMYINRVKDLKALNAKWDKLIDLRANGEDVDDFLYNVEDDLKRAVIEFELLRLILDEDVPNLSKCSSYKSAHHLYYKKRSIHSSF